jgi:thiosulfate dehydrogenase
MPLRTTALIGAAILLAAALPRFASAQEALPDAYKTYIYGQPKNPGEDWILAYGGRLYDLWWAPLEKKPPETTQPSYPKTGPLKGALTWRCVSCHGWDYRGDPALGTPGLLGMAGRDPADIARIVRNSTHRYTPDMIPDAALQRLATFVSKGLYDMRTLIDEEGRAKGDPAHGRDIYQNLCAACHDYDGKAWIDTDQGRYNSLAAVAAHAPKEALHKMLNGQPSADMPALRALGPEYAADILAYAQTLEGK